MTSQQVVRISAALGTLLGGGILASGGAGLSAWVSFVFLVAAPATAVAVSLHRLDPLARITLALTAAIVVNTLVAEVMLVPERWSIPAGVMAVTLVSAGIWLAPVLIAAWPVSWSADRHRGADRHESMAQAVHAERDGAS